MRLECLYCRHVFGPFEFSHALSEDIEAERKAIGADGILFRAYVCSVCGRENLLVDLHPLDGESDEGFEQRKQDLERMIRQLPESGIGIGLAPSRLPTPDLVMVRQ